jgi:hypothetical protein
MEVEDPVEADDTKGAEDQRRQRTTKKAEDPMEAEEAKEAKDLKKV